MSCSIDELKEKQEDISDLLDELFIFPTRKGLQKTMDVIRSYFALEKVVFTRTVNENIIITDEQYRQIVDDQEHIINGGKNILSHDVSTNSSCCKSNWIPAPKSIDKGIDKNMTAQLVLKFAEHVELFNSLVCSRDEKK